MTSIMRALAVTASLALSPAPLSGQAPVRTEGLTVSEPATVATLDMGRLKGEPSRLAWSLDGSELYVQTREGTFGQAGARLHHYVFSASRGSKRDVDAEPAWASAYWTAKSAQASPDDPRLKIDLKTERRQQRTTSIPMGGEMARGGASTSALLIQVFDVAPNPLLRRYAFDGIARLDRVKELPDPVGVLTAELGEHLEPDPGDALQALRGLCRQHEHSQREDRGTRQRGRRRPCRRGGRAAAGRGPGFGVEVAAKAVSPRPSGRMR